MSDVRIQLTGDRVRRWFEERSPSGGSPSVRYEIGFVVVTDSHGVETGIPAADVLEVVVTPTRRGW